MVIGAYVVTRRAVAVGELGDGLACDEGFQVLVDGRQTDLRQFALDVQEDLFRRRVVRDAAEVVIDGSALARHVPAAFVELLPQLLKTTFSLPAVVFPHALSKSYV